MQGLTEIDSVGCGASSRPHAALLGLLLITSCLAMPVFADTKLFEEAKALIAASNPKQAYLNLLAKENVLAGNVEYDYLLGVAALDSGKVDEAIIAFERVLAVQPNNAGAQLDLARAYFTVGSLDLAEGTFKKLRALNPPPAAMMAIDKYLVAISERRLAARRMLSLWGEMALGYDSNLTGVPNDFTTAIQQAFNLVGVLPTGNSIKRKAPYLGTGVGADLLFPISERWNGYVGADLRGRGYKRESEFNSGTAEVRAAAIWDGGQHQFRFNSTYNAFEQRGDAPGEPQPTNDRRSAVGGTEYRYTISGANQLSFGAAAAQTRFPRNNIEDFNSTVASISLLTSSGGKGSPLMQLTGYGTRDRAVRKLADGVTDKSKKVSGIRLYGQTGITEKLSSFSSIGYSQRRDDSPFARATTVEYGRDKLADVTLGINWRFQAGCNLRAQWFGSRNNSNIAIYDYTRHEVSSTIRCEFL
ncbi:MAG: tetratricopeptide repeat protein [Rhodocyclaceae bacterium]|jgi:hypothetical protein|nr:tetratricopeptide repeat protein [Rhodocyclaceae bacterium]MCA3082391.1 tetratricopeptide repeat protein [Rhodocyclaceae bacterium]